MDARRTSPALRAWFDSSRVVDDEGNPLVVYHGTQQQFSVFQRGRWPGTINDIGFWLASEQTVAEVFASPRGRVLPVYLKIANPRYIDASDELVALWCEHAGGDRRLRAGDTDRFRQWLTSQGHDGIAISAADVDGFASGIYLVALEPIQIKSALNRGAFDPTNPDINDTPAPRPVRRRAVEEGLAP